MVQDQNSYSLKVNDAGGERELDIELIPGAEMLIGRLPTNPIPVSWDREISREHATLTLENGQVRVACLELSLIHI